MAMGHAFSATWVVRAEGDRDIPAPLLSVAELLPVDWRRLAASTAVTATTFCY